MDIYLTITAGLLFSISEILPLINEIQSNGIIHLFIIMGKKFFSNTGNTVNTGNERSPLLESEHQSTLNIDIPVLQTKDFYEIQYITNYIQQAYDKHFLDMKTISSNNKNILLKMNYTIDYDSINDIYKIKW